MNCLVILIFATVCMSNQNQHNNAIDYCFDDIKIINLYIYLMISGKQFIVHCIMHVNSVYIVYVHVYNYCGLHDHYLHAINTPNSACVFFISLRLINKSFSLSGFL